MAANWYLRRRLTMISSAVKPADGGSAHECFSDSPTEVKRKPLETVAYGQMTNYERLSLVLSLFHTHNQGLFLDSNSTAALGLELRCWFLVSAQDAGDCSLM